MRFVTKFRRAALAIMAAGAITLGALSISITLGALSPVSAQISDDARIALDQYGSWRPHPRFGEVWVPGVVPPDWRPYEYGHWVYTDEWGWYWVSDDAEADWGWVVFHYGRWVFERDIGWFWVPGDEWAPAWVNWRYGDEFAGWAPLPPDELIGAYEVEPAYWVFVPCRYMAAPRLRTYIVPVYRRTVILRTTRVVNRTFPVHGARLAVNPGISPAFVARVSGAPVSTYHVRPRVFASTQSVSGAVQVRRDELRGPGGPREPGGPGGRPDTSVVRPGAISVQRTTTLIQPNAAATAPQPLGKNEPGQLGTRPPRAAQGVAPSSTPPSPPSPSQRQAPAVQQVPPGTSPRTTPPGPPASSSAPTNTVPLQRGENRERVVPGGPSGGPPPQQPSIVRPIPPQAQPPSPPPQQRQMQPPPPERQVQPPPPQQRQMQPPPERRQVQPQPPPLQQRQMQSSPGGQPPPQAPGARAPGPPPKKPPPKPGEKQDERK